MLVACTLGSDTLKLRETPRLHAPKEHSKECSGVGVTASGTGITHAPPEDNPQPSPVPALEHRGRFRDLMGVDLVQHKLVFVADKPKIKSV